MADKSIKNFFQTLFSPLTAVLDYLQRYAKGIFIFIVLLLLFSLLQQSATKKPNLMEIELNGALLDAKQVLKKIESAQKKSIKGVLFVVNSPGGAVAPSIEISLALKRLKAKKPVIVYASGTLASGSYYASIWSDKIIANPGTIVGSIGVILESFIVKDLLDKIGVKPTVIKKGQYKEAGTPFREWRGYEKAELQKVIDDTYAMFVKDVAKARKLPLEANESWANAHIFTAKQAKEIGLIDEVGDYYRAKKELEKLSGLKKPVWAKPSKIEELVKRVSQESVAQIVSLFWPKLF